jgi:D-aminopeptidase
MFSTRRSISLPRGQTRNARSLTPYVLATMVALCALGVLSSHPATLQGQERPRARDLGVPFEGRPGRHNAITDVDGVTVGHATIIAGDGRLVVGKGPVRTGVTAVMPRSPAGSR